MGKLSTLLGTTIGACLVVTLLAVGILRIDIQPAMLLIRNVFIAALGGQAPGLSYESGGPELTCDFDSGNCETEEQ